jgi:hypothetical protein
MDPSKLRVYVSSTLTDLKEHRQAVLDALRKAGAFPIGVEEFVASAGTPIEVCKTEIQSSDLVVLIVAHRYGYVPAGQDLSVTEFEFRAALDRAIPILAFLVDDNYPWSPELVDIGDAASRLKRFKERVRSQLIVGYFTSPSDLAVRVLQALTAFRSKRGLPLLEAPARKVPQASAGARDELVIKIEEHLNSLRAQVGEIREQIEFARSDSIRSTVPSTRPAPFLGAPAEKPENDLCFVAMPYSKEWSKALEETLLDICKSAGMKLLVARDMDGRFIPNDIWRGITSAAVIVADITDGNPNVAYEIGLADVLGKEVVLLCQGDKVPFDFLGQRLICYENTMKGSIVLHEELTARLRRAHNRLSA